MFGLSAFCQLPFASVLVGLPQPILIYDFHDGGKRKKQEELERKRLAAKNKAKVSTEAVAADGTINSQVLYTDNCAICHGGDGKLGMAGAADLSKTVADKNSIQQTILNGKGLMKKIELTPDQATAIAEYVENQIKGK